LVDYQDIIRRVKDNTRKVLAESQSYAQQLSQTISIPQDHSYAIVFCGSAGCEIMTRVSDIDFYLLYQEPNKTNDDPNFFVELCKKFAKELENKKRKHKLIIDAVSHDIRIPVKSQPHVDDITLPPPWLLSKPADQRRWFCMSLMIATTSVNVFGDQSFFDSVKSQIVNKLETEEQSGQQISYTFFKSISNLLDDIISTDRYNIKHWYRVIEFTISLLAILYLGFTQYCNLLSLWKILDELLQQNIITNDFYQALPSVLYARVTSPLEEDVSLLDALLLGERSKIESKLDVSNVTRLNAIEGRFLHQGTA